jgi:hypothetical protein
MPSVSLRLVLPLYLSFFLNLSADIRLSVQYAYHACLLKSLDAVGYKPFTLLN